ncbi:hypothetical protein BS78_06G231800 [Paspalum vaginatum]|nr:hypothetical protein BS78_06G231800 [Paspalum vaginatum]
MQAHGELFCTREKEESTARKKADDYFSGRISLKLDEPNPYGTRSKRQFRTKFGSGNRQSQGNSRQRCFAIWTCRGVSMIHKTELQMRSSQEEEGKWFRGTH